MKLEVIHTIVLPEGALVALLGTIVFTLTLAAYLRRYVG